MENQFRETLLPYVSSLEKSSWEAVRGLYRLKGTRLGWESLRIAAQEGNRERGGIKKVSMATGGILLFPLYGS